MDYVKKLIDCGLEPLKIAKYERESTIRQVLYKFCDHGRKYRIVKVTENNFWFEATKYKCRYFHPVKSFATLEEAEKFIFTSESGDLLPE